MTNRFSSRGAVTLAVAVISLAGLTACDQLTGVAGVSATGVQSVVVSPSAAQVAVGQTTQLVATIAGDSTQGVTWRSANAAIATVDTTGVVLGVAPGVTSVTAVAKADTAIRGTATVTVVAATASVAPGP